MNNIAETLLELLVMQSLNLGYFIEYMYHHKADREKQIQHSICSRRLYLLYVVTVHGAGGQKRHTRITGHVREIEMVMKKASIMTEKISKQSPDINSSFGA